MSPALLLLFAQVWTVRVEEPTGLYRRTNEVVSVPLAKGNSVTDAKGRAVASQVAGAELLFPVSLIPGELPEFTITKKTNQPGRDRQGAVLFITARRIGMSRLELANSRFRVVIDTEKAAIVEAYSLTAAPQRMLNLVETTPEDPRALKADIHGRRAAEPSVIEGENTGWTSLGGSGAFTKVDIVENGPLRGRVRLERPGETWEFLWTAGSAALRWRAVRGFRFAAVSAAPYLPFDRFTGGSEYEWPAGPEAGEPPDHDIGPRDWKKLPGGHAVYYRREENYGALGIVALDGELEWRGIGSRRFEASKSGGATEIAITFPEWKGDATVLEARREYRILKQPVIVSGWGRRFRLPQRPIPSGRSLMPQHSLDGDWELAWGEKGAGPTSEWRTVRVPGSAHVQWLGADKAQSREAEWVSYKEWWYRKRFTSPWRRARLQFDATDYYADAYLNGVYLGRHEGYIDPYEYTVALKPGENELLVRVWTPVSYYWRHRPYYVKGSYGNVDQKPDDITALGVTRSVRLAPAGPAIRDIAVATRVTGEIEVHVEADRGALEYALRARNFEGEVNYSTAPLPYGRGPEGVVLRVENPRLWWTWDHGRPNLYTLTVTLKDARGRVLDARELAVGIREIEKRGWHFYLNRRRMFIRGTNYYYNLFLSEMDRAAYARDLKLMLGMNVNMIRLHCHFTNPEFYDLADENGVLVWQDYLEAWYPHDTAFSLRAAALYDPLVRYVRNHPSIALWATSDEEDLENYRDLTKHLQPVPAALDPQRRPVVRSTGRYGDAHVYYGWYGGSIWQYTGMTEEFVSELGATALANYESLIRFLPNHWPIREHEREWIWRKLQIPEAMRAWGDPGSLTMKEYIPRTQAYVARLFQIALERMRRLKYAPAGGILHFHAIDIWPSVTMAAIDYYRVPTKTYDVVRRSFAPVAAVFEYDRDHWKPGEMFECGLWAINDEWRPVNADVRWRIEGADAAGSFQAAMPEDSAQKIGVVRWRAEQPGHYRLIAEVVGISENVFEFSVQ